MVKKTQLYNYHIDQGHMVEFAGFSMPLWYEGITSEVVAVRTMAGLFDISHMGRAFIAGSDAMRYLNYITTNDVSKLNPGDAHYTVMCNQKGGVIDDMVILHLEENRFMTVFNAANRDKDLTWMQRYTENFKVEVEDISDKVAMIAVQGPQARTIIQSVSDDDVQLIKRFGCGFLTISGQRCIASGTGYTGEDGLELFILDTPLHSPHHGIHIWNTILDAGETRGIRPCGLGARDVLRIEAGMCLYGHELTDQITPYEARIGFIVKLDKGSDFIGCKILEKQKSEGVAKIRVGLQMRGPGIPRIGCKIIKESHVIGEITSGTFSPILKTGIGIGYVPKDESKRGSLLQVSIRDKLVNAEIVRFPFYDTSQYGYSRTS